MQRTPMVERVTRQQYATARVRIPAAGDDQEHSELPKGQPLFDSLFVFENAPVEVSVLDRAQSLNATSDSGRTHTNFPLTAVCYPGDDLGLHLSYDQRYFDETTVQGMLGEFKRLLLALVQGFHGDMADLPLIGEQERGFLVEGCNQSEHAYPLERSYIELFEEQVAAHPQRIAANCLDQQWTYEELNRRSNGLGHALIAAGVGLDQPVALLAERNLDLLGMIIGSFKAGAGYLPLDPVLPSQRLRSIIDLSRTPLLVCTEASREQAIELLEGFDCQLLVWEEIPAGGENPGLYSGPDNLAYVIYTSGSTGKPKGTLQTHHNVLRLFAATGEWFRFGPEDVWSLFHSYAFDFSVWEIFGALLHGGRQIGRAHV